MTLTPESAGAVLVCVTPQRSCTRLIKAGEMIALSEQKPLKVLSVFAKKDGASNENSEIIEELYEAARLADASMSVYFNDNPDILAAVVASKENVSTLVTGFPRERSTGFVDSFHGLLPNVKIIMIDENNETHRIMPEDNK